MKRYMLAAVLGCLYLAGSIFIVQIAGNAHRGRLNKAKLMPGELATALLTPKEQQDTSIQSSASQHLTRVDPEPVKVNQAPTHILNDPPKPAPELLSPAPPAAESSKEKLASSKPAGAVPPLSALKPALANPLANSPFWNQDWLKRDWDVAHLTADKESRLGAELHKLIVHLNPILEQGPELQRVEDAAKPFRSTLNHKELEYRFFILDSDAVNAFSTPGGYVYVSRGLLDFIAEDEDYALEFAIGHEIAHVDLRHTITCLMDRGVMSMPLGTIQKIYMIIIPGAYLETGKIHQEFEADDWVAKRMQGLRRTRREILMFLAKLEGYAEKHGFRNGRITPAPARGVENHYRAKTAARKRSEHLKEFMAAPPERPK